MDINLATVITYTNPTSKGWYVTTTGFISTYVYHNGSNVVANVVLNTQTGTIRVVTKTVNTTLTVSQYPTVKQALSAAQMLCN